MKLRLCTTLLASVALMETPAMAQSADAAQPSDGGIAEIIVTAQKREQKLNSVPMSISAASGDQLISRSITTPSDLSKIVPGFTYVESASSTPIYALRGIGFNDTSLGARPTVSVYLDEAPLTFSVMSTGAQFDLERLEVLKGPQGTLFGQNSTGGAINYIAAKPTQTFKAGIDVSYGRFNTADFQGYVSGPVSETLSVRVAARAVIGGGWQKSYTRDDTLGEKYMRQGRFLADWRPTDRLKVSINLNGFIDKSDTPASQLIGLIVQAPSQVGSIPLLTSYPLAPKNSRAADWTPGVDYARNNRFYQAIGRIDYDLFDNVTLTSLTSYGHYKTDMKSDSDGTALFTWETNVHGHASTFNQELRASGTSGGLTWLVGGNYSKDKSFEDDFTPHPYSTGALATLPFGATPDSGYRGRQLFDTKAVFGNVDYEIGQMFTLHAGARYTKTDLSYSSCTTAYGSSVDSYLGLYNFFRAKNGLPAVTTADVTDRCISIDSNFHPATNVGELNQHNVSWRAGIDFKPADGQLIYANVSRGYKAGSAPVSPSLLISQFTPVTQEKVTAYEVGFKSTLFDRRVQLNGAVFYYDYLDKQLKGRVKTTPNLFGPLEALVNIPKSSVTGGEIQLTVSPIRGLTLTGAGTYVKTKVRGDFINYTVLASEANFKGNPFPYTPTWQVDGDASYEFDIGSGRKAFLGSSISYRSATNSSFGSAPMLAIDDYTLVDVRAGLAAEDDSWRLTAFGQNIANTYYWTNVAKITDTVRRIPGMPASYGVRFSLRFK